MASLSTLREIKLLRELHHENIVSLTDVVINPRIKQLALVFDWGEY